MQIEEVLEFLQKIKVHYPNFEINDNVAKIWGKELSILGKNTVEEAFNKHLEEYPNYEPRIHIIKKSVLRMSANKKALEDMTFICNKCKKIYDDYEDVQRCEEKHLRMNYIELMCNKFNLNVGDEFGILEQMSLKDIDIQYDNFMFKICKIQKEQKILQGMQEQGLRSYYVNVLMKKGARI